MLNLAHLELIKNTKKQGQRGLSSVKELMGRIIICQNKLLVKFNDKISVVKILIALNLLV